MCTTFGELPHALAGDLQLNLTRVRSDTSSESVQFLHGNRGALVARTLSQIRNPVRFAIFKRASIDEECSFILFELVVDKRRPPRAGVAASLVHRPASERRHEERKDAERNGDIGVFLGQVYKLGKLVRQRALEGTKRTLNAIIHARRHARLKRVCRVRRALELRVERGFARAQRVGRTLKLSIERGFTRVHRARRTLELSIERRFTRVHRVRGATEINLRHLNLGRVEFRQLWRLKRPHVQARRFKLRRFGKFKFTHLRLKVRNLNVFHPLRRLERAREVPALELIQPARHDVAEVLRRVPRDVHRVHRRRRARVADRASARVARASTPHRASHSRRRRGRRSAHRRRRRRHRRDERAFVARACAIASTSTDGWLDAFDASKP